MPLETYPDFETGDVVQAETQDMHARNFDKLDRRTGRDPLAPYLVLCAPSDPGLLPSGIWQLIGANNLGSNCVTTPKINAKAVTDAKIDDQTILNRSLATNCVDARALAPGSIVAELGYTPADVAGEDFQGPVSASSPAQGARQIGAICGSQTIGLYGNVAGGFGNAAIQTGDAAIMGFGPTVNQESLFIGIWSTITTGLGLRFDGPNGNMQISGALTGNDRWSVRRNGPPSTDTGLNIMAQAQLQVVRPLGGAGVPAITLTTEGASGFAFYEITNEPWIAQASGGKGKVWTQLNDGTGSGLDADTHRGLVPGNASGQIPIANTVLCDDLNAELLGGQPRSYYEGLAGAGVPAGVIVLWEGAAAPSGWTIMTGWAGRTPFQPGANGVTLGGTGGVVTHDHQIAHTHAGVATSSAVGASNQNNVATPNPANADNTHTHNVPAISLAPGNFSSAGGGLPPYIGVNHIKKS